MVVCNLWLNFATSSIFVCLPGFRGLPAAMPAWQRESVKSLSLPAHWGPGDIESDDVVDAGGTADDGRGAEDLGGCAAVWR
jgi:hypothetical protein